MDHPVRQATDAAAAGVAAASFMQILPDIAALASILWYAIQLVEYIRRKRQKKDTSDLTKNG